MLKKDVRRYVIEGICALLLIAFSLLSYMLTKSMAVAEEIKEDYVYVSNEIINNALPVISTNNSTTIGKPYSEEGIEVAIYFYDKDKTTEEKEKAIYFYEDTYIQNTGVDYKRQEVFSVQSILDGRVLSITTDEINGTTVKIEHEKNVISVYQSLSDVTVRENDTVSKGEVIGQSGENAIGESLGKHLHFELSINNVLVDPEKYYGKALSEI